MLVGVAIGSVALLAVAGYFWTSRRTDQAAPPPVELPATATTTGVATTPAPAVQPTPLPPLAPLTQDSAEPPKPAKTDSSPKPVQRAAQPPPQSSSASAPASPAPSSPAPQPAPKAAAPPAATTASETPPPAEPVTRSAAGSVTVKHRHGLSFRKLFGAPKGGGAWDFGRDGCEGTLQILASGFHFKTTTKSTGRAPEDEDIPLDSIRSFKVGDGEVHIETEFKNWDFVATPNALRQIEQELKRVPVKE
jgi:hypothetical protein